MNMIIWKHVIPEACILDFCLHKDAKILNFQRQEDVFRKTMHNFVFWEMHRDNEPVMEIRKLAIYMTENAFEVFDDEVVEYINTVQDGILVFHLFELKKAAVVSEGRLVSIKKIPNTGVIDGDI